jgi:hypothetical protein
MKTYIFVYVSFGSVSTIFISFQASAIIPILVYMACDRNMRGALLGILRISTPSARKEGRKAHTADRFKMIHTMQSN